MTSGSRCSARRGASARGSTTSCRCARPRPAGGSPRGPPHRQFADRFGAAYEAELAAFIEVAAGRAASPCTLEDALEAFYVAEACELSRQRNQPVQVAEVRQ